MLSFEKTITVKADNARDLQRLIDAVKRARVSALSRRDNATWETFDRVLAQIPARSQATVTLGDALTLADAFTYSADDDDMQAAEFLRRAVREGAPSGVGEAFTNSAPLAPSDRSFRRR